MIKWRSVSLRWNGDWEREMKGLTQAKYEIILLQQIATYGVVLP
jgi:hypothetical protein